MNPWDGIISDEEQRAYNAAGFGRRSGIGSSPALLIIDVQYRTVGTRRLPFWEAVKEFPTSCGEVAWDAVENIAKILAIFRERDWPVLYPYVSPKESFDRGRLSDKVPAIMNIAQKGLRVCARDCTARERYSASEKASQRVLRNATRELFDQRQCRHARRNRLYYEWMRPWIRRRRIRLQFSRTGSK